MAGNRKLLAEVDRTMKKVQEGVEVFDEIWEKVQAAPQQSLREKFEADLKKEIKKLQRYRDSIKGWIAGNDIKDTSHLIDARKLIETKMETFKMCEKQTKTKAYSKEGLAQAAKLDPEAEARNKCRTWAQKMLQDISDQVDSLEAEIESLESVRGKRKDHQQIEELESKIGMHKWHIDHLEMITRALDNQVISIGEVDELKDDIEYYVESNNETDFFYDDSLYEPLDLEAKLAQSGRVVVTKTTTSSKPAAKESQPSAEVPKEVAEQIRQEKQQKEEVNEIRQKEHQALLKAQQDRQLLLKQQQEKQRLRKEQQSKERALREKQQADEQMRKKQESKQASTKGPSVAAIVAGVTQNQPQEEAPAAQPVQPVAAPPEPVAQPPQPVPTPPPVAPTEPVQMPVPEPQVVPPQGPTPSEQAIPPQSNMPTTRLYHPNETINPVLNTRRDRLNLLESSFTFMPDLQDSERAAHENPERMLVNTNYSPSFPCNVPREFPDTPPVGFDNPVIYEKMDADTLFFIFYNQQGTLQQFLAARELKRQSWRYHKKYLTWFQRHEDPEATTSEYEIGTYIYFDWENGWCKRIKKEFTFEYIYLEDDS